MTRSFLGFGLKLKSIDVTENKTTQPSELDVFRHILCHII